MTQKLQKPWPELCQDLSLAELANMAYSDEGFCGETVHEACYELQQRGYSKHEVFNLSTWGN